jgi:hypothetical protein
MFCCSDLFPRGAGRRVGTALVLAFGVLFAVGCGDSGPRRYDLSGTVTFDGKPIPAGSIVFQPDTTAGNSGPQGTAEIRDGKYDTAQGGKGVVGGPHVVRVRGLDRAATSEDDPVQELFPEYELKQDLPKESGTVDIQVPAEAAKPAKKPVQAGGDV